MFMFVLVKLSTLARLVIVYEMFNLLIFFLTCHFSFYSTYFRRKSTDEQKGFYDEKRQWL